MTISMRLVRGATSSNSMRRHSCWWFVLAWAWASAWACPAAFAAPLPTGYPGPGEYRIDTDAVISVGNVGGLEQRVQTDGATGNVTTTNKAPDGAVATNVVKGDKPVTWCIKPATSGDVPRGSPFLCQNTKVASAQFSAVCGAATLDSAFRAIDARTWEHTMTAELRADRAPVTSARAAIAMASAGMTPAQRAEAQKALAEMPSQAEMDNLQAEMLRDAEEEVRTAKSPREADSARQVLAALRKQMNGTAVQRTIRVKERWTLINATCSTGR